MQKAVIYCRVSDKKQMTDGHGLDTQEHRCRQYAQNKGYEVEMVFRDADISGTLFERKAMRALISFLKKNKDTAYIVMFDDLKRFSRNIDVYRKLKTLLFSLGANLECLNFRFEDTPEGEFVETVIVATGELECKQNRRQVLQKMKARMEAGYWCLSQPTAGYMFKKKSAHGKILVPNPHEAPLIKEVLEGFAYGRFSGQQQIIDYLTQHHFREGKVMRLNNVRRILEEPIYAGYYEYAKWGVQWMKGKHEALISLATHWKIQEKLTVKNKTRVNRNQKFEFPLRGLVTCGLCAKVMTSSIPKGRSKYYPRYTCNNTACTASPKHIDKDQLESDYMTLLDHYTLTPEATSCFEDMLTKLFQNYEEGLVTEKQSKQTAKASIQKQIHTLMDRICKTNESDLISMYETKLIALQKQLSNLDETTKICVEAIDYGTAVKRTSELLQNPCQYWQTVGLEQKRQFHQWMFIGSLSYSQNEGFGTAQTSPLFGLCGRYEHCDFSMVDASDPNRNQHTITQILEQVIFVQKAFCG